jgi:hypothetical protein
LNWIIERFQTLLEEIIWLSLDMSYIVYS